MNIHDVVYAFTALKHENRKRKKFLYLLAVWQRLAHGMKHCRLVMGRRQEQWHSKKVQLFSFTPFCVQLLA